MTHSEKWALRAFLGIAACVAVGSAAVPPSYGYEPTQSTGTGTSQGQDGSMTTQQGGNTGPTTGRNEQSGSATGAVRHPSQSEPGNKTAGESQTKGSSASHQGKQQDSSATRDGHSSRSK